MPLAVSAAGALLRSCHPVPSAAVTAAAVLLAVAAGNSAGTCVLLGAAVLTGQLSIGWSNDRIDVDRDRRVGHEGKPVAAGEVALRVVDVAIVAAVLATCVLSLLLGWRPGLLHLATVAAAWAYNGTLKATVLSWLPYAFAFGALPSVATLALPGHPLARGWITAAAALVGTAVNFANARQDLAGHPRSDVHGLPDRLGGRASLVVAVLLLAGSGGLVTWAPAGPPRTIAVVGAALTAGILVLGGAALWRRAWTRLPFYVLLLVVPVQLIVLAVTARPLH